MFASAVAGAYQTQFSRHMYLELAPDAPAPEEALPPGVLPPPPDAPLPPEGVVVPVAMDAPLPPPPPDAELPPAPPGVELPPPPGAELSLLHRKRRSRRPDGIGDSPSDEETSPVNACGSEVFRTPAGRRRRRCPVDGDG